jgi:hypothetical protein
MKRILISILIIGLCNVILTSCLEEYLDKAPESGLPESEVFSKYENVLLWYNSIFEGGIRQIYPLRKLYDSSNKVSWDQMTDLSDQGRVTWQIYFKYGPNQDHCKTDYNNLFQAIRKANLALQNIDMLQDASQEDIDDFKGLAYHARAFAHLELCRTYGGMPYVTKVIGPYDQWDIPRLPIKETMNKVAADFDTAAFYFEKAGKMRRDPLPGQIGHLNATWQDRPNGVAAKAMKGRALLYAASPLANGDKKAWEDAAKANWEAIQIAKQYGYALLTAADYKKNFVHTTFTNEQLWGWYGETQRYNSSSMSTLLNGPMSGSKTSNTGECPTQNCVDRYETKWGDPLNTQADRDAAAALGHYNEQDPYVNRDPRFYVDVIFNTCELVAAGYGPKCDLSYEMVGGVAKYAELVDRAYAGSTKTGYYGRKRWPDISIKNQAYAQFTDPIIRLAELYLNYAEAANEAYGPNTPAPGATMTAAEAVNFIRARWADLEPVQSRFTTSTEAFRPRIKNERCIELSFEGAHYFHDIRRWKDAPVLMAGPVMGVDIEKVTASPTYPTGFKYTRYVLALDRQTRWIDAMYYFPFRTDDNFRMKNFTPNVVW